MSLERRLRRRSRARHPELAKATIYLAVFGDARGAEEVANDYRLAPRTVRRWLECARGSRIPALAADLRARHPATRIETLAQELLDEIARGGASGPLPAITETGTRKLEEIAESMTRRLAELWQCQPEQVRERILTEHPAPTPGVTLEERNANAVAFILCCPTVTTLDEGGGIPPLPCYFDPNAYQKFMAMKETLR